VKGGLQHPRINTRQLSPRSITRSAGFVWRTALALHLMAGRIAGCTGLISKRPLLLHFMTWRFLDCGAVLSSRSNRSTQQQCRYRDRADIFRMHFCFSVCVPCWINNVQSLRFQQCEPLPPGNPNWNSDPKNYIIAGDAWGAIAEVAWPRRQLRHICAQNSLRNCSDNCAHSFKRNPKPAFSSPNHTALPT
jgi:hypothetical protein